MYLLQAAYNYRVISPTTIVRSTGTGIRISSAIQLSGTINTTRIIMFCALPSEAFVLCWSQRTALGLRSFLSICDIVGDCKPRWPAKEGHMLRCKHFEKSIQKLSVRIADGVRGFCYQFLPVRANFAKVYQRRSAHPLSRARSEDWR